MFSPQLQVSVKWHYWLGSFLYQAVLGPGVSHLLITANPISTARKRKQRRAEPELHPSSSSSSSRTVFAILTVFVAEMIGVCGDDNNREGMGKYCGWLLPSLSLSNPPCHCHTMTTRNRSRSCNSQSSSSGYSCGGHGQALDKNYVDANDVDYNDDDDDDDDVDIASPNHPHQ